MTAVRAEGVERVYDSHGRKVTALAGIDVAIQPGELVAVTGRSGSGKTTLLNLLGGLDQPTAGAIFLGDVNLATLDDGGLTKLRRGRIGYIFQSFGLLPALSAEENIDLPLRIAGTDRSDRLKRVGDSLEAVGLLNRRKHRPDELSGGEQQRVAIARAIAIAPAIVLADEPTAELDSTNARTIFGLLRSLVDRGEVAMVVATHDRSLLDLANRVFDLRDGRLV